MNNVTPPRNAAQPGLSSTLKIYGAKKLPTIRVKLKDGNDDREILINEKDFDHSRFVRLNRP